MNYYERHLGDYARDTSHLTIAEHGAYTLLLDRYYATERPIPADQVHRLARARSADEIKAVDDVLAEFFTLADGFWRHSRCDAEIAKKEAKTKAARENGKTGGRPKKHDLGYENETQQKPTGLSLGYENETQQKPSEKLTRHQTPDTRHQTPLKEPDGSKPRRRGERMECPDGIDQQTWGDFMALRKSHRAPLTATALQGIEREAAAAGYTLQDALATCCTRGWRGFKADWVAPDHAKAIPHPQRESFGERDARLKKERDMTSYEEFTGKVHPDREPKPTIIDVTPLTTQPLLEDLT